MTTGMVFDIKEFAVHDGPGIRTTVFLKGCPLRCAWCHNPEALSPRPQRMTGAAGERIAGREYTPHELAYLLNRQAAILKAAEGGVTFSGGEPLMQPAFLLEVIDLLDELHVVLDTSGYAGAHAFRAVLARVDLVYFDLKLIDPAAHLHYTGVDNAPILHNLQIMAGHTVPYVIRVPLIPGVTDTDANLAAIAATVRDLPGLLRVDLLPYNQAAGSKYAAAGMVWNPPFDEARTLNLNTAVFEADNLKVCVA
jgi:pyruvate formate lyase activating enzyme